MSVQVAIGQNHLTDRLVSSLVLPDTTDHQLILDLLNFLRYLEMGYTRRGSVNNQAEQCQVICRLIIQGKELQQHQLEWILHQAKKTKCQPVRFLLRKRARQIHKKNRIANHLLELERRGW